MSKNDICVFNTIADDYLPQQQLFTKYFKKIHPDIDIYCITLENTIIKSNLFETIPLNKINTINNFELLKFKYNILELSTAVKPSIFQWLFNKYQYKKILYFDSDILVYQSLNDIIKRLDDYEAVITPHIRETIKDNKEPSEIDFTKSGYFNAGFLGLKRSDKTIEFLKWWADKTNKYCYIDFDKFYFVDQRWLDYTPIFLNTHIIKEPGYNVAYFNLQEYIGKIDPKKIFFIHFSGFDKDKVSVYQNRFNTKSLAEYSSYFNEYNTKINFLKNKKNHPYKYDFFDNKAQISHSIKKIFLNNEVIDQNKLNTKRPFKTNSKNSIYNYLNSELQFVPATNLARLIYLNDPLLQLKFPNVDFSRLSTSPLFTYIFWFINESEKKLKIDKKFVYKQKKILEYIEPILKLHSSFIIKNKLFRLLLRLKYFFLVLRISDKRKFTKNIYLFLLERNVDQKTLKNLLKSKVKISEYKILVMENIINSGEFKELINSNFKQKLAKLIYKLLTLTAVRFNKII